MTPFAQLALLASSGDDWGHAWWPIWPILWTAVIGTLVWLFVRRRRLHDPLDRGREVLAERFARGELSGEEYRTRLDELQGGSR